MNDWSNLSEDEQRAVVTAVRLGQGGRCTAAEARVAIDWAAAVRRRGSVRDAAWLAEILRGELVMFPRPPAVAA